MTHSEALQDARNRAAQKVARAALDMKTSYEATRFTNEWVEARDRFFKAVDEYEEAERRAMKEATL